MRPPPGRRLTWPIVGLMLVVAAFGLAIAGIALSLQQAEALSTRLTVHAQARAGQIAATAAKLFHHQLNSALQGVAEQLRSPAQVYWTHPQDWPTWIIDLFSWDGATLTVLEPGPSSNTTLPDLLRTIPLAPFVEPSESEVPRATIYVDDSADPPHSVAVLPARSARASPIWIVAEIDPRKLKAEMLDSLVALDDSLEVVPSARVTGPWSQTIVGAVRVWSIQPSASYAHEQRSVVLGQTVAYLGLTLVSLSTMLAAMWFLARVARREISLAEMKANFVADVSHELKTPLALIRLFGETLLSGRVASEEKRREYYAIITRESTRLTNLINNILDFSRIEAGKKQYNLEPIDIGHVVTETYMAFRAELDDKGFEHRLTVAKDLPKVPADRDSVSQAVLNLMSNAVKYSDEDRFVGVEVRPDTRRDVDGVLISVHDRGIGIRPEDRPHLFEGFYRAPDGRVRERAGTGLGLSVVKHIVDAHLGTIEVESRLVKGSTFKIFLPGARAARPISQSLNTNPSEPNSNSGASRSDVITSSGAQAPEKS